MSTSRERSRRTGHGFIITNIAILTGSALFLFAMDAVYRDRVNTELLQDSKFLTTEWHLMKELKERTDQELRDKDEEIAELRRRYQSLKVSGSSSELISAIEEEMKRAEAQREAILQVRLKAEPPSAPAPAVVKKPASGSEPPGAQAGAARPGSPDTALSDLLRARILALEEALRSSLAGEATIKSEIEDLRRSLALAQAQAQAVPVAPAPPDSPAPAASAQLGTESDALVEALAAAIALERDALADPASVLGLADLKTRALLRAIVRTPAIRAEYPELLESLDRYLSVAGRAEYLRGQREAYEAALGMIEAVTTEAGAR